MVKIEIGGDGTTGRAAAALMMGDCVNAEHSAHQTGARTKALWRSPTCSRKSADGRG